MSLMAAATRNPIREIVDVQKPTPNPDKKVIPLSIGTNAYVFSQTNGVCWQCKIFVGCLGLTFKPVHSWTTHVRALAVRTTCFPRTISLLPLSPKLMSIART